MSDFPNLEYTQVVSEFLPIKKNILPNSKCPIQVELIDINVENRNSFDDKIEYKTKQSKEDSIYNTPKKINNKSNTDVKLPSPLPDCSEVSFEIPLKLQKIISANQLRINENKLNNKEHTQYEDNLNLSIQSSDKIAPNEENNTNFIFQKVNQKKENERISNIKNSKSPKIKESSLENKSISSLKHMEISLSPKIKSAKQKAPQRKRKRQFLPSPSSDSSDIIILSPISLEKTYKIPNQKRRDEKLTPQNMKSLDSPIEKKIFGNKSSGLTSSPLIFGKKSIDTNIFDKRNRWRKNQKKLPWVSNLQVNTVKTKGIFKESSLSKSNLSENHSQSQANSTQRVTHFLNSPLASPNQSPIRSNLQQHFMNDSPNLATKCQSKTQLPKNRCEEHSITIISSDSSEVDSSDIEIDQSLTFNRTNSPKTPKSPDNCDPSSSQSDDYNLKDFLTSALKDKSSTFTNQLRMNAISNQSLEKNGIIVKQNLKQNSTQIVNNIDSSNLQEAHTVPKNPNIAKRKRGLDIHHLISMIEDDSVSSSDSTESNSPLDSKIASPNASQKSKQQPTLIPTQFYQKYSEDFIDQN